MTDVITRRFLNMVDQYLNEHNLTMSEDERIKAADMAIFLFVNKDYDEEDWTVEDAINNILNVRIDHE